jgi:hypothetical protein
MPRERCEIAQVFPVEIACAFLIKHREFIASSQDSGEG